MKALENKFKAQKEQFLRKKEMQERMKVEQERLERDIERKELKKQKQKTKKTQFQDLQQWIEEQMNEEFKSKPEEDSKEFVIKVDVEKKGESAKKMEIPGNNKLSN